ncbi:MAG: MMPL family transporter [Burkholderiales bacterium]|nr:MMPL family transporter [Burkholderiales bacterium]
MRKKRLPLAIWIAALFVCIAIIANTRFVSDLSAFMPKAPSERQQLLVDQLRDGIIGRLIMIGIEGGDAKQRAVLSLELARQLRKSGLFSGVQNGDSQTEARDRKYFFENRYLLSPAVTPGRFTQQGMHAAISDSIDALSGDAGMIIKRLFAADPTGETLALLEEFSGNSAPGMLDGAWASKDGKRAVLIAYTREPGTDTEAQARAIGMVKQTFAALPGRSASTRLVMSGTGVFSVKSRDTIEGEVTRLAGASLILVVCLLLAFYRSFWLLALGLLPVVSGALAGIAMVSLGFGYVHSLTLGFGTTLIGEAVDYSIYFYLQRTGELHPGRFWKTIWVGVATSIAGFAALLFSGFPGLAQLGTYSISGLIAAALVTRYVLPSLVPEKLGLRDMRRTGLALDRMLHFAPRLRLLPPALLVAACAVIFQHEGKLWNRNLSTLSPISTADQQLDQSLRSDLGAPDLRFMVAFSAPDTEHGLEGAEEARAVLEMLEKEKVIAGFSSPAFVLPSLKMQRTRQAAIPARSEAARNLDAALEGLPVQAQKLQGFLADLDSAKNRKPLTRSDLEGTSAALLYDSMMIRRPGDVLVLMPLREADSGADRPIDVNRVQEALGKTGLKHPVVLDLLEESTRLFENYRNEVLMLSELGCIVIVFLLLFALKSLRRTLRVIVPLACAVACVTALLLLGGTKLTILHLVGLLLVVAIGSNYALFFENSESSGMEERRRMQISLLVANLTAVGSFGMLGLSSIPLLSAIGTTVGLGAFFSLIFSAILSRSRVIS